MSEKKFTRGGSSKNSVSCVDEEEITLKLKDDGRSCSNAIDTRPCQLKVEMERLSLSKKISKCSPGSHKALARF